MTHNAIVPNSPETLAYTGTATPEAMPAPGPRWVAVLLVLSAAVLWSFSGIAVKWARIDPISFTALRSLGAALAMAPLLPLGARLTGRARPRGDLMALTAVLHTVMVGAFISAMTYASAAEGIFLQYSAPAWAALFGWMLLGRRVDRATVVALGVALTGIAVILGMDRSADSGWLGPALGVLAGITYGGVILCLDAVDTEARRRTGTTTNVLLVVFISNLTCGLALGPWAVARGVFDVDPMTALVVILVGGLQLGVPYVLFQLGLRRLGPVSAGLLALIEPILNPIWAWLGAGEVPPRSIYAGGALILAAVVLTALFGRRGRRVRRPEKPQISQMNTD